MRWTGLSLDKILATAWVAPTKRPVANLSFALSYWAGGPTPAGFRALNVLIHVACAVAVALLARALLALLPRPPPRRDATWMALLAGLLFVAHPLQTNSVTYVVQRMNALAALFYLTALLAWLRGRLTRDRAARVAWWALALVLGVLALGSKEIAVTLPAAIWLVEWFFLRDLDRRFALRSVLLAGIPLLALAFWLVASVFPQVGLGYAGRPFSAGERLLTELRVVVFYAGLALLPLPSRLNLLHDFALSHSWLEPVTTLLAALTLVATLCACVWLARRAPLVSFGILWFGLHLVVESFALPLALVYEHRTYLPLVGPAIAAPWLLFSVPGLGRRPALAAGLIVVALLCVGTVLRNRVWDDELRFWSDVARKSPGLVAARNNHALALMRAGQLEAAAAEYRAALEIEPDDAETLDNLGNLKLALGDRSGAVASFRAALRADPHHLRARHNLGIALAQSGQLEAGIREIEAALQQSPLDARVWNTLGALRVQLGRLDEAEEAFATSARLDPAYTEPRDNLAAVRRMLEAGSKAGDTSRPPRSEAKPSEGRSPSASE